MNELVSIIMPSYNTAKYILEAINSVLNQTYKKWELIIVDDCSNDDTDDIVKNIKDDRIIYLKNEKNRGAAFSRNRAIKNAKGKWIAFLDSDDLWLPEKLEKQVKFMKENDYHFSYCNYWEIDSNSKKNNFYVSGPKKITKRGMYRYCWPGCLTVMYDAEFVGLIQIFEIEKNNDYAMWLNIIKKVNCYLLDEKLAYYRRGRSGSISTGKVTSLIKWHYLLFRKALKMSIIVSLLCTVQNIFYGLIKRIFYRKK